MKVIIKSIAVAVITFLLSLTHTFANDLIFVGEEDKNWFTENNKADIKQSIDSIQEQYGLNMDIVILGANDEQGCYTQTSIDQCVQNKYYLASDLVVVIKMKSAQSSSGDIRSLIADDIKNTISTSDLKSIQDSITSYFKKGDFYGGVIQYNKNLSQKIQIVCDQLSGGKNCNVFDLNNNYEEERNRIALQEAEKKHQAEMKQSKEKFELSFTYIFGGTVGLVIGMLFIQHLFHLRHLRKVKQILKDVHYRESIMNDRNLFPESKDKFIKMHVDFRKSIETYLSDKRKDITQTKSNIKKYQKTLDEYDSLVYEDEKIYSSQKELANDITKLTDINL